MRGYNRIILIGNVVRDPEIRKAGETRVASFTLAVTRQWKSKNDTHTQTHTDFINCTVWGSLVQVVENYVRKGNPLHVEGRLQTGDYLNKERVKVKTTEVVVDNLLLLGKNDGERRSEPTAPIEVEEDDSQITINFD